MHIFLETERLVLRRFTEDDADNLVDLDSDPDVMRFINGGKPTPRDVIQDDILPSFLEYSEHFDGFGFWAAIEKLSGEFIGWFHFRAPRRNPQDEPELGYRLRKTAWRNGCATEGSRALIQRDVRSLTSSVYSRRRWRSMSPRGVLWRKRVYSS